MKLLRDSFWQRALRATRLRRRASVHTPYAVTVPAPLAGQGRAPASSSPFHCDESLTSSTSRLLQP